MENLTFTLNVVAPVFLIIILGLFLKIKNFIDDSFINISSKIVFRITLPAFIFTKLSLADFKLSLGFSKILLVFISMILFYVLIWIISIPLIKKGRDRASFIQGSFRSNFVIIGFAILYNMFGDNGVSKAALLLVFLQPFFNLTSIIALTVPVHQEKKINLTKTFYEILTNPLLLAVILATPFSYFKIQLPTFLAKSVTHLAALTLPLALIGIGGSLNLKSIKKDFRIAFISSVIKIIILPIVLTTVAIYLGFTDVDLGVLFILFATPTAVLSFILAKAMDCNAELAGNIIVLTTLGSILTISTGIYILRFAGYF